MNAKYFFVSAVAVSALVVYFSFRQKDRSPKIKDVILIGGLDNRKGDKTLSEQKILLQQGFTHPINIIAFRYNDTKSALEYIRTKPNTRIVLFSAGCSVSKEVAEILKSNRESLNHLYIVEPYHSEGKTTKSVQAAVRLGVPTKNVLVGAYSASGMGIVENARPTPKCTPNHWCSLTEVGKIINTK
tara:strand:+ start:93 stop:650 length:558 start_codon:yes stop_codon:yes gene_type:complete